MSAREPHSGALGRSGRAQSAETPLIDTHAHSPWPPGGDVAAGP
ncbi:hypothetical protein SAMN05216251_101343 [Actinacidiphila alni]|uniref:Uncharacterized protein n=1 Tax=Actinacidiphila alni TaxID=380248 RepID=A0A1I1XKJ5_9ACTN|nr:hypothetical protein [Actinacidiphila alni]SFE05920.1 hypothetical protein SAMN05216251_101343 [Actinacidiphila alni]